MKATAIACGMLAVTVTAGCSSSSQGSAGTTSSTAPSTAPSTTGTLAPLPPPPGSYPVLSAQDPAASQSAVVAATPTSKALVAQLRQTINLSDVEAACVVVRLDAYPALRDTLGTDPQKSPRLQDVTDLATDCIRVTTGALNWVNGLQAQANPKLTSQQMNCLRDGYAGLSKDANSVIVQGGLNPGTTNLIAEGTLKAIFSKCGVDYTKLAPPP